MLTGGLMVGAATGAAIGSVVAGPVGLLVGVSLGAVAGAVGVKNMLDEDPPSSRKSSGFQVGYDEKNTNPLGRAFYARVKYKFWFAVATDQ